MRASCVEELQVYQKALRAADAVSAILKRPYFHRDPRLRDQLGGSSGAVAALIAEGFGLSTDRHFAAQLYRSRGESKETRTHLTVAMGRDYITAKELESFCFRYHEIEKMLTGLIRHLEREDRKHRG
jgi:four helix bundle protein